MDANTKLKFKPEWLANGTDLVAAGERKVGGNNRVQ